jgi:Tat protein translocase TatB subunit
MGFLGIGLPELALIFAIAVIVLGPERIPGVAVQLARALKFIRGYATDATAQLRSEFAELTKEYEEVRKELQEFRKSVARDVTSVTSEVASVGKETRAALDEAQPIVEPGGDAPPATAQREGPSPPEAGSPR